jgi:hypothetical protein
MRLFRQFKSLPIGLRWIIAMNLSIPALAVMSFVFTNEVKMVISSAVGITVGLGLLWLKRWARLAALAKAQ